MRRFRRVLTLGWVVMSQGLWYAGQPHWFDDAVLDQRPPGPPSSALSRPTRGLRWPLMTGVAAGMAAMITPTCGALGMLAATAAFVAAERRKRVERQSLSSAASLFPRA